MRGMARMILFLSCCGAASPLMSQSLGPAAMPDFLADRTHEEPSRLAAKQLSGPLAHLSAAAVGARDEVEAVAAWNAAGRLPAKNGFTRRLPLPQTVRLTGELASGAWDGGAVARRAGGELVWSTRVDVESADRLRLHLTDVTLPVGTKIWVWSADETRGPFGPERAGQKGEIWTPSVHGGSVWIEVALPADAFAENAAYGFALRDLLELVDNHAAGLINNPQAVTTTCLVDGRCVASTTFAPIASYRSGVASLEFVENGSGFLCTGSLLNDSRVDFVPYLLTANHCISTQAVASTLDAVWDYYDTVCDGTFPNRSLLPASHGASLLATSIQSDFAFLELSSVPAGRFFLGWNAGAGVVVSGTKLFRLSHPAPAGFPFPQTYSTATAKLTGIKQCTDATGRPVNDTSKFIHSVSVTGEPFPGSSGSSVVLANGQVVGQLLGTCPGVSEPCLVPGTFDQLDGAFAATYPAIKQWLSPSGVPTAPCLVSTGTKLCVDDVPGDGRFAVTVSFQQSGGVPAPGNVISLKGLGISAGGLFWFFNPANPEMLIKVLNGCALGGHYWVFYAAGTNVGLSTTVLDTRTGNSRTYTNAIGTAAPPVQDTAALPCT